VSQGSQILAEIIKIIADSLRENHQNSAHESGLADTAKNFFASSVNGRLVDMLG
jgi:hypothetical protein